MARKNLGAIFTFLLTILLFVVVATSAWIFLTLPTNAETVFGPAEKNFTYTDRLFYAIRMYLVKDDLTLPLNRQGKIVKITIKQGEAIEDICSDLVAAKLIRNSEAFTLYLVYSGYDRSIQAGEYKLSAAMNAMEIARTIQNYSPTEVAFNILAGWRLEEVAGVLPTSGLKITPEEFLKNTSDVSSISLPEEYSEFKSFEGLLLPGSYTLKRNLAIYDVLTEFLRAFDQKVNGEIRAGFKQQGLTLYQGVILASIVEREAVLDEEKPQIASVFINRLNSSMKLESDPTVQYAVGYDELHKTWWKSPLYNDDLAIDSPYNTYLYPGLPPAPICNPGIKALRAVAFPAKTNYYYFRAKCDQSGQHDFSETYEEHVSKACP